MKLAMIVMGWLTLICGGLVIVFDVPINSLTTGLLGMALGFSMIDNGGK